MTKQLRLNAFGDDHRALRGALAAAGERPAGHTDLQHYVGLARLAERGTFDSLFPDRDRLLQRPV
jgi:hypothetical protein